MGIVTIYPCKFLIPHSEFYLQMNVSLVIDCGDRNHLVLTHFSIKKLKMKRYLLFI